MLMMMRLVESVVHLVRPVAESCIVAIMGTIVPIMGTIVMLEQLQVEVSYHSVRLEL
jgi:hypothetical protein